MKPNVKSNKAPPRSVSAQTLREGYVYPVAIDQAAPLMGISKSYLRKILSGDEVNPARLAQYQKLCASAGKTFTPPKKTKLKLCA